MKTKMILANIALLLMGGASLQAEDAAFTFSAGATSGTEEFQTTSNRLSTVIKFAYYVMYLLGGTMLAASGFKLKAGDMPGFYKMAAGGVVVFLSPFLVQALLDLSANAT